MRVMRATGQTIRPPPTPRRSFRSFANATSATPHSVCVARTPIRNSSRGLRPHSAHAKLLLVKYLANADPVSGRPPVGYRITLHATLLRSCPLVSDGARDRVSNLARRRRPAEVRRAQRAARDDALDRSEDAIVKIAVAEMVEHQRTGPDRADRVR